MRLQLMAAAALVFSTTFATAQKAPKLNEGLLRAAFHQLKDSDSAKFRDVEFRQSEAGGYWTMCGHVNAKNAYGGYVGFTRFMGAAMIGEDKKLSYLVMTVDHEIANQMCAQKGL